MGYRVAAVYRYQPGECGETAMTATEQPLPIPSRQTPIAVMTFNIKGQAALMRRGHLRQVAAAIGAASPDVVGLQEVHRGTWQSRFTDQPAQVLAALDAYAMHFGTSTR